MPEWGTVASLGLGLAALVTALGSWFKIRADADTSIASMALAMVKEVRLDVERLKIENAAKDTEIAGLRTDNEKLRERVRLDLAAMEDRMEVKDREIKRLLAGVSVLCTQVVALGQEPMFRPGRRGEGGV
jgi:hypothetical protein